MRRFVETRPRCVTPSSRIVFIEDDEEFREVASLLMRGRGHSVIEAGNGIAGLELIEHHVPDVAFVDLSLPGINGYQIARSVRARRDLDCVMLVAVTCRTEPGERELALASGFDVFLSKPVYADDLEAGMRAMTHS